MGWYSYHWFTRFGDIDGRPSGGACSAPGQNHRETLNANDSTIIYFIDSVTKTEKLLCVNEYPINYFMEQSVRKPISNKKQVKNVSKDNIFYLRICGNSSHY